MLILIKLQLMDAHKLFGSFTCMKPNLKYMYK